MGQFDPVTNIKTTETLKLIDKECLYFYLQLKLSSDFFVKF